MKIKSTNTYHPNTSYYSYIKIKPKNVRGKSINRNKMELIPNGKVLNSPGSNNNSKYRLTFSVIFKLVVVLTAYIIYLLIWLCGSQLQHTKSFASCWILPRTDSVVVMCGLQSAQGFSSCGP